MTDTQNVDNSTVDKQQIKAIFTWSERMARVETTEGSGMNVAIEDIPAEAFKKPEEYNLCAHFYPIAARRHPDLWVEKK